MRKQWVAVCLAAAFGMAFAVAVEGRPKYRKRAGKAGNVLEQIMAAPDSAIPEWILNDAVGIIVIPSVKRVGLGLGGRYGRGIGTYRHRAGAWGPPLYYSLHGGSFGFQIGGQAVDVVLVLINEDGVDSLLGDKVTLGASAGIAAGPVGRNAEVDTNLRMRAKILSYARSRGLFAGISLEGAVLKPDPEANRWAYGRGYDAKTVVYSTTKVPPDAMQEFVGSVSKYAPRR